MSQALPYLVSGLMITLVLTAVLAPVGFGIGLGLALMSEARSPVLRWIVRTWVNVFRTMPPLVLIIVTFSALPFLGVRLPAILCAIIALLLNNTAYYCEIIRAGLGSVSRGQMEAARSTGLGYTDSLRYVVLPQALRNVLPDLASNTIEVVKATSLASIVGVHDLLYSASTIRSVTFNTSSLTLAAIIYLIILLPAVRLSGRLERKPQTV
ncbi:ABC polar amino acid transporter, inner membrane subunit [Agrobacterium fabacearum CFBP 5771]|nr:amino acid ABC transporter permease [Agrobacterium tumefaciens]CVI24006.1 ABC polar amino acid transporter, inner membrane subunit [Agrobacterium fabacearum CFBP 5771]